MPNQSFNTKLICIALVLASASLSSTAYPTSYQDAITQLGYNELAATFSRQKALAISTLPDEEKLSLTELQAAATLQLLGASVNGSTANSKMLAEFIANYNQLDPAYLGQLNESSLYQRIEN